MVDWLLSRSISGSEEGRSEEAVVSRLRKLGLTRSRLFRPLGLTHLCCSHPCGSIREQGILIFSAANSQRLNLFERSVKCGVEFCFFLVRACLGGTREIFA